MAIGLCVTSCKADGYFFNRMDKNENNTKSTLLAIIYNLGLFPNPFRLMLAT